MRAKTNSSIWSKLNEFSVAVNSTEIMRAKKMCSAVFALKIKALSARLASAGVMHLGRTVENITFFEEEIRRERLGKYPKAYFSTEIYLYQEATK